MISSGYEQYIGNIDKKFDSAFLDATLTLKNSAQIGLRALGEGWMVMPPASCLCTTANRSTVNWHTVSRQYEVQLAC
jgi:hypothetical protein